MKILISGTSFYAKYGGPAFSVSGLARALVKAGARVGVWAPDGSAAKSGMFLSAPDLHCLMGTECDALRSFGVPDILHDNGIWLPHNHRLATLSAELKIARVVSLRGMIEPWSFRHKRWKKRVAWYIYQRHDLARAACHHATSTMEAESIGRLGLGVPTCIVPNGIDIPECKSLLGEDRNEVKSATDMRKALFVGRIHPKKGLTMLIEAWCRVMPRGWCLQIVGPDEEGHRSSLERLVREKGLEDVIRFSAPVSRTEKRDTFFNADLFVLPSFSENFGIVIAEALAHGVPVLTTTGTPWSEVRTRKCGWWVAPTVEEIASGLFKATSQNHATLKVMGERGRSWMAERFSWPQIANEFLKVYELLMSASGEPLQSQSVRMRVGG